MFIVKKGFEKKKLFVTHNTLPQFPKIKFEPKLPNKEPIIPKIIKIEETKPIIFEKKIIQTQNKNPKNLFCILHNQIEENPTKKLSPPPILAKKRIVYNENGNSIGRWNREEHTKFIEAIIKFGNNWKEVQDYVGTRTSTQARSHAQKFFEKIKKNNTIKYFEFLKYDSSDNFTNATISQLHRIYGDKSNAEINQVVQKFLTLEYDLPKKRRKYGNYFNYNKRNEQLYEENEEEEDLEDDKNINNGNNEQNNFNSEQKNNNANYYNMNENYPSMSKMEAQKPKTWEINYNNNNNIYEGFDQRNSYGNQPYEIDYIINQFVNNISELTPNDYKMNKTIRKNTVESYIDEKSSLHGQENNPNFYKSRKNSIESVNKFFQNEKNDFFKRRYNFE